MKFDNNGNLFPYREHTLTFDEFGLIFGVNARRKFLILELLHFLHELRNILTDDNVFRVDGSFVTKKIEPKDIDVVIFVNFQYFKAKESQLTALKQKQEFVDLYM